MIRTKKSQQQFTEDDFQVPSVEEMKQNSVKAQFDLQQAEEIWRLAAQLQAEEANRQAETRHQQSNKGEDFKFKKEILDLNEVSDIAQSAGIDPRFVEMALQNQQNLVSWESPVPEGSEEKAAKYLDFTQQRISVKRRFNLPKSDAIKALQTLFKSDAYKLSLLKTLPSPNPQVETLIFEVPLMNMSGVNVYGQANFNYFAYYMTYGDINRLAVTIREIDENQTEIEILGDLKWGKRRNWIAGTWTTAFLTGLFGMFGFAIGENSGMGALMGATLGGSLGAVGGLYGWRAMYGWSVRKAENLLDDLLYKVAVNAKNDGWS